MKKSLFLATAILVASVCRSDSVNKVSANTERIEKDIQSTQIKSKSKKFNIEIDVGKLNRLYSHILRHTPNTLTVHFQEKIKAVSKIEQLPNSVSKSSLKFLYALRGLNTALAEYKSDEHKIIFYFPNWPQRYIKNHEVFKKEIIATLAHECGHALGHVKQAPFLAANVHYQINNWLHSQIFIFGLPFLIILIFFILRFRSIISTINHPPASLPIKIFLFVIASLISLISSAVQYILLIFLIVILSIIIKESAASTVGHQLIEKYNNEFQEIVNVTKI